MIKNKRKIKKLKRKLRKKWKQKEAVGNQYHQIRLMIHPQKQVKVLGLDLVQTTRNHRDGIKMITWLCKSLLSLFKWVHSIIH